jgi:hypothetical protein
MTLRREKPLLFLWGIAFSLFACPDPVSAIQTHGGPEGLYAHQMAHVGFLLAMIYIYFKTRTRQGAGWGMIRLSFILFALWNLNTLTVHAIENTLSPLQFQGTSTLSQYFLPRAALEVYYYFGKMDHLLCVPAAVLLGLGLKKLDRFEQSSPHAP